MAITTAQAWAASTNSDPTGSLTIGSGTERLLVFSLGCEFNSADVIISTFTVGGQSADYIFKNEDDPATGEDTFLWFYCWDEASIDAMSGSSISFTDDRVVSHYRWTYATYEGVDQTTPFVSQPGPQNYHIHSAENVNDTNVTGYTSSAGNKLVMHVARNVAARDITDWDTLTEQVGIAQSTVWWYGVADGDGVDSTIALTGDGSGGDFHVMTIVLNAAGGAAQRGIGRGACRGIGRGIG